jgi:hypothetical protein
VGPASVSVPAAGSNIGRPVGASDDLIASGARGELVNLARSAIVVAKRNEFSGEFGFAPAKVDSSLG